jgi:hypothetical protein
MYTKLYRNINDFSTPCKNPYLTGEKEFRMSLEYDAQTNIWGISKNTSHLYFVMALVLQEQNQDWLWL